MKLPFLISLMFASMAILALGIVALSVLPPDHADPNPARSLPAIDDTDPKKESGNAPSLSAANLERRLTGHNECGTVTTTVIEMGKEPDTTMTSFTTVISTHLLRREANASSSIVTPTLSQSPSCVPVTVTETNTVPATRDGTYLTIGTLTVIRTLYSSVNIPNQAEGTHTDGPESLSDTVDIPHITEPRGITTMRDPPQVTSGASDNDTKTTTKYQTAPGYTWHSQWRRTYNYSIRRYKEATISDFGLWQR